MRMRILPPLSVLLLLSLPLSGHARHSTRQSLAIRLRGGAADEGDAQSSSTDQPPWTSNPSNDLSPLERSRATFLGPAMSAIKSQATKAQHKSPAAATTLKNKMDTIRTKAPRPRIPSQLSEWKDSVGASMGPASVLVAGWFYQKDKGLTLTAIYALSLLGSLSGFYLFLYFITVGYASGILLPVLVSLMVYSRSGDLSKLTVLHSSLVVLWAVRSAAFFLWREHVNWPQLHEKMVEVNKMARVSSKLFCWLVYSCFYVTLVSPCLYRLQSKSASWGYVGKMALAVQAVGILLESIADYQKSAFKAIPGNRNQWCNTGLFSFSTFPNYLGELVFWYGTYFGAIACFEGPQQWIMATLGVVFISIVIKGAISSLGAKHLRKYGTNVEFLEFRRTHGLLGPNPFVAKQRSLSHGEPRLAL